MGTQYCNSTMSWLAKALIEWPDLSKSYVLGVSTSVMLIYHREVSTIDLAPRRMQLPLMHIVNRDIVIEPFTQLHILTKSMRARGN